jgi:hypothetical protein
MVDSSPLRLRGGCCDVGRFPVVLLLATLTTCRMGQGMGLPIQTHTEVVEMAEVVMAEVVAEVVMAEVDFLASAFGHCHILHAAVQSLSKQCLLILFPATRYSGWH